MAHFPLSNISNALIALKTWTWKIGINKQHGRRKTSLLGSCLRSYLDQSTSWRCLVSSQASSLRQNCATTLAKLCHGRRTAPFPEGAAQPRETGHLHLVIQGSGDGPWGSPLWHRAICLICLRSGWTSMRCPDLFTEY